MSIERASSQAPLNPPEGGRRDNNIFIRLSPNGELWCVLFIFSIDIDDLRSIFNSPFSIEMLRPYVAIAASVCGKRCVRMRQMLRPLQAQA